MSGNHKTIRDCTLDDFASLADASIELLACARFMSWVNADTADQEDTSVADTLEKVAAALAACGLPQITKEEFDANLEQLLRSGLSPAEWSSRKPKPHS